MDRKVLLGVFILLASFALISPLWAADECVTNCGNPPIGAGGGGGGGSSDDLYLLFLEDDADADGVGDTTDSCIFVANRDQLDSDGDEVGDACDNCTGTANLDQRDSDADGLGNACEDDDDGDGVLDAFPDNCQYVFNPTQAINVPDATLGDACNPDFKDWCEGDGSGDPACLSNIDGDNYIDNEDNCITVANNDQIDTDVDGIGNKCDDDIDGDGVFNTEDNCPLVANPDQTDEDRDGLGDNRDDPSKSCDENFCFQWKRDTNNKLLAEACIDPTLPFVAHAAYAPLEITAGDEVSMTVVANRNDVKLAVAWTVVDSPAGGTPIIEPADYETDTSEYYAYYDQVATTRLNKPGTYVIKMTAELVDGDDLDLGITTSSETFSIEVAEGGGGCSITSGSSGALSMLGALLMLAGVVVILRRKR